MLPDTWQIFLWVSFLILACTKHTQVDTWCTYFMKDILYIQHCSVVSTRFKGQRAFMSHLYLNLCHLYCHIHYFQSYPIIWMFSKSIVESQGSCPLSNTSFYLEHSPLFVFTFGVFLTIQIKLLDINHCFVSSPNIINYGNIMILVELQVWPLLPYYDLLNVKVYVLVV